MSNIYDKASLVLIPSGTKTSKVYSQVPVNGDGDFTFSRSTAATRVNADGNIEKETQNLLLQSNSFDTTWTNPSSSITGGQSGYDGTSSAWLVTLYSNSGSVRQDVSASGVQTFSVYAKAGNTDWVALYIDSVSTNKPYVYFDLGNGVVGSNLNGNAIKGSIEDVGSGWYRCSVIYSKSTNQVRIFPADSNNVLGSTGDNIYIQDAQLEQGLVARDYIETTTAAVEGGITDNVPRLDYTDSSCPALLLEPQRTNLIENSEYYEDWLNSDITFTTNTSDTTSPEGLNNSTKIDIGSYASLYDSGISVSASTQYTFSFYAKNDDVNTPKLAIYDESNSSFISVDVAYTISTSEWKRIEHTFTTPSGCTSIRTYPARGAMSGAMYLFGAQLEAGSYATSYIPTYGTSVTRNADANITITSASSIIGQQEGTFYLEIDNALNTPNAFWYNVSDSSYTNWIFCGYDGNNFRFYVRTGNSVQYDSGAAGVIGTNKIVFIYKSGAIAAFVNGTQIKDATTAFNVTASLNYVTLGSPSPAGGSVLEAYPVKQALLFPTALTDQEAIDLTTI